MPYAESALLLGYSLPSATGSYVRHQHLVEALRPRAQKFEDFIIDKV